MSSPPAPRSTAKAAPTNSPPAPRSTAKAAPPRRAWLIDRIYQWEAFRSTVHGARSAVMVLHGHRGQALFEFVRRVRHKIGEVTEASVVVVRALDHGQDRGEHDAALWCQRVQQAIINQNPSHAETVAGARDTTLVVAIEVPNRDPKRHAMTVDFLADELPRLVGGPGSRPLFALAIVADELPPSDGDPHDQCHPLVMSAEDAFDDAPDDGIERIILPRVVFPPWPEVALHLKEQKLTRGNIRAIKPGYEALRANGGRFMALAELLERHYPQTGSDR